MSKQKPIVGKTKYNVLNPLVTNYVLKINVRYTKISSQCYWCFGSAISSSLILCCQSFDNYFMNMNMQNTDSYLLHVILIIF